MNCQKIKKLIPEFLDKALNPSQTREISEHILSCQNCQREVRLYEKSWQMLLNLKEIEPAPGYISRFWTKVSLEMPWYEKIFVSLKEAFVRKRLAPVLVTISIMIIVGSLSSKYINQKKSETALSKIAPEEIELLSNMDLAQNLEIIEEIDNLDDLDIIEAL